MLFHKEEREMQCSRCCHGKIAIIYNNIIYYFFKNKIADVPYFLSYTFLSHT